MKDDIWSILGCKLAGEATERQEDVLNEWLLESDNMETFETIRRIRLDCDYGWAMQLKETVCQETMNRIFETGGYLLIRRRRFRTLLLSVAASIAVLLCSIGAISMLSGHNYRKPVEFSSTTGISRITLPDGTNVMLNKGSRIVYAADFNKSTRTLTLEGEAFFDVARNPGKPFIVKTGKIDVRVLGTSFNVRAYPDCNEIITSLVTGSLEMTETSEKRSVQLIPGQEGMYVKSTARLTMSEFDSAATTGWMYDELIFQGESFRTVCDKLERQFNVQIVVKNESLHDKSFIGRFVRNESLDEILEIIRINVPFSYEKNDGVLIIY